MSFFNQVDLLKLPRHIAIIMDGNGRWARQKGNERVFGHRSAIDAVRDAAEGSAELGVDYLTLFAFSTENWRRPKLEVEALMKLLIETIRRETATLTKNEIKLQAIGDLHRLPKKCFKELREAMEITAANKKMTLTLALSYGSRADIVTAAQKLAADVLAGKLQPENIDETLFEQSLSTCDLPNPELLIRTSGECRISNFLLWEIAYAEIYFTHKLWPDFRREDLYEAIIDFQKRERRFGKISEQIHTNQ